MPYQNQQLHAVSPQNSMLNTATKNEAVKLEGKLECKLEEQILSNFECSPAQVEDQDHPPQLSRRDIESIKGSELMEVSFWILLQSPQGIAIPDFYQLVYRHEYHSLKDQSRLNSLIERARRILGGRNHLLRRGQKLELSWMARDVLKEVIRVEPLRKPAPEDCVLQYFKDGHDQVSISELEREFSYPRRSLQYYLKNLVKKGVLVRNGRARSCAYSLAPVSMGFNVVTP